MDVGTAPERRISYIFSCAYVFKHSKISPDALVIWGLLGNAALAGSYCLQFSHARTRA